LIKVSKYGIEFRTKQDRNPGGSTLIQKLLSTAFCWLNPHLAENLVDEFGFDGLEVVVGRRLKYWPYSARQIHPTHRYIGQSGPLVAIERLFLGNIEESAGWGLAREHNRPLILHENTLRAIGLDEIIRRSPHGATVLVENIPEADSVQRVTEIVANAQHGLNLRAILDIEHVLGERGWLGEGITRHLDWARGILADTPLGGIHVCGLYHGRKHTWLEDTACNADMLKFVAEVAREHECPVTFEPSGTRPDQLIHCLDRDVSHGNLEALKRSADLLNRYLV